jgi:ferric-dicitrate binding protein FerR (iron transport regulator)
MEELLNRYFVGMLSDREKVVLFKQLEQDDALKAEYVRLQNLMAISGMVSRAGDERHTAESFRKFRLQAQVRQFRRIALTTTNYAAVVLLLIGVWYATKKQASTDEISGYTLIEAPKGQRVHVTLADGTEAWLSSRTQLRIPDRFNKSDRTIELDGEGFFSVSKNGQQPFIVQAGQYHIQVTGTQFNVLAYAESPLFETDLMEGAVSIVDRQRPDRPLRLFPNEKASVRSGQLIKSTSTFTGSHYIKNGIYSFENRKLKELSMRLELWYHVKINITKPEMANYSFSGKFRQTDDIGHILQAIKETGKFNYRMVNEQQIEIY